MRLSRSNIRDIVLFTLMIVAAFYVALNPAQKHAAEEKIDLQSIVSATFGDWVSKTYDTSDYRDKWQSINELLTRAYYNNLSREKVQFILEYSSDLRKNFSFHFPEGCYRAGGNEIEFLDPIEISLPDDNVIKAKCLYIKGSEHALVKEDNLIVYWLVIDNKQYYRTFFIKLDQMLAGILGRSKKGFLVRVDYSGAVEYSEGKIQKGRKAITRFIKDFYRSLRPEERTMFFGTRINTDLS